MSKDSFSEYMRYREGRKQTRKNAFSKIMKNNVLAFSNFMKMLYLFSKIVKEDGAESILL
jgi:hypothetical protein